MAIEVIAFESLSDGKAAAVTKSVDFGTFGIAASIQGAAALQPRAGGDLMPRLPPLPKA